MTMKDTSNRSYTSTDHTESTNCSYSYRTGADSHYYLEELAATFQLELLDSGLVKDHKSSSFARKIKNSFSGDDAVGVLHSVMPRLSTREDALVKGNEIMTEFRLFSHATDKEKPLLDSASEYYQMDHNLPSQVYRVKELYSSYWDKAWLIEQHIECKDRRHKFKTYPNCFVAKECVDTLMHLKLVKSRKEAVFLMRKLIEKVCLCEPANPQADFKDDNEFFYLVPKNKRIAEPPKRRKKGKRGEDSSQTSRSTIHTKSSLKTTRTTRTGTASVKNRAESVRNGFVNHRESKRQSHSSKVKATQPLAHFPVNLPR